MWDGNVDIAKLNFFVNPSDYTDMTKEQMEDFERGTLAVKDYAINSGKYWTQLTSDTQIEFIADKLSKGSNGVEGYLSSIYNFANAGIFPDSVKAIDEDIVQNVLDGSYKLRKLETADTRSSLNPEVKEYSGSRKNEYTTSDYIFKKAIDTPLETLPVSSNLLSIITSPFVVQRPIKEEELGVSKYDLARIRQTEHDEKVDKTTSQMNDIYENKVSAIINSIVQDINVSDSGGNKIGSFV